MRPYMTNICYGLVQTGAEFGPAQPQLVFWPFFWLKWIAIGQNSDQSASPFSPCLLYFYRIQCMGAFTYTAIHFLLENSPRFDVKNMYAKCDRTTWAYELSVQHRASPIYWMYTFKLCREWLAIASSPPMQSSGDGLAQYDHRWPVAFTGQILWKLNCWPNTTQAFVPVIKNEFVWIQVRHAAK